MDSKDALVVFEGTKIRRIWYEDQWYFSVVDVIQVITAVVDQENTGLI